MSGTTSVPAPSFGATGFSAPAQTDILAGVLTDFGAAFPGINPSLSTPQGQLASSLSAIVAACYDLFVFYSNQTDPAYASGRMQDAIGRIYFISRLPAESTVVQATCGGLAGVMIPSGALAQDTSGNLYSCTGGGTIGAGGSISLPFASVNTGPIVCAAGALSQIYQAVPGWDTIINPAAGVAGQAVETRTQFEARRQQSVAINATGSIPAIQGAVLNVPGVLDAFTTDNSTGSPVTLDGVTVPANALYVCVVGGAPQAVAQAIWSKKQPGCPTAGNTSQTVQDTSSGYNPPYPSYTVNFQTAAALSLIALVKIANSTSVPSNALALVQTAMLNAMTGADGGPRQRINSTVYASRFYAGIAALGAWAQIISIQLGSAASPSASFTGSIGNNMLSVTTVSSGTLAVGQSIEGTNIGPGTVITTLGSGTGGTGTYYLSRSYINVSSEAMTAITPNLNDVVIGAAHTPTLNSLDISLTLV